MKTRYIIPKVLLAVLFSVWFSVPTQAQNARVQLVNASVDRALEIVDVYLDGVLWRDDFLYASATPFEDVTAGTRVFALAPASSSSVAESFKTFDLVAENGKLYHAILSGVLDPSQFPSNPEGLDTNLKLFVSDDARETSTVQTHFQVRLFHGLMNGPSLDFHIDDTLGPPMLNDASFGDFSPYIGTEPSVRTGIVTAALDATDKKYWNETDFATLGGQAFLEAHIGFMPPDPLNPRPKWLRIFPNGTEVDLDVSITAIADTNGELPSAFRVSGNYPNPFNPVTTVLFDLPASSEVRIDVFDLTGRLVLSVPETSFAIGTGHGITIDASSLASGIYMYRVTARAGVTEHVDSGLFTLLK